MKQKPSKLLINADMATELDNNNETTEVTMRKSKYVDENGDRCTQYSLIINGETIITENQRDQDPELGVVSMSINEYITMLLPLIN